MRHVPSRLGHSGAAACGRTRRGAARWRAARRGPVAGRRKVSESKASAAAATLWRNFQLRTRIDELPAELRPTNRAEGYAVQAEIVRLSGRTIAGWKIAATSQAGQRHIGVDGPMASALLDNRVVQDAASVPVLSLDGNIMNVAEAEFAFRFGKPLPRRSTPYSRHEVLDAVESMHPGMELPDSRYTDFLRVGAPQLIADLACACWFVLGPATKADWRSRDLVTHRVDAYRNGELVVSGVGANVLGDPIVALTWMANELAAHGRGLGVGEFVTTGTCVVPVAVAPGDRCRVDLGDFGAVEAALA